MISYDVSLLSEINECVRAIESLKEEKSLVFMEAFANLLASTFVEGGKLILAGNGGSLCDAAHFAEELTGFFRLRRKALPAIVLSEPGHLTCTGNDAGFDQVFSRGVEAFGKRGDIFCALTTSGNSSNITKAFEAAQALDLKTVLFLGKGGGKLRGRADLELSIDGFKTSDRVQEAHMAAIHLVLQRMETLLFS